MLNRNTRCQRLQKEDKEKAQGDDKFSVGVLHLGTERGDHKPGTEGDNTQSRHGTRRERRMEKNGKRTKGCTEPESREERETQGAEGVRVSWVGRVETSKSLF